MSDENENNVVDLNTRILMSIRDEISRTRTELSERIATLEAETIRGFTAVRLELDHVGRRIDQTNNRLDQTNERLDQTNERLAQTNERLAQTNERIAQTNERIDHTNERLDHLIEVNGVGRSDHEQRITRLETAMASLRRRPRA